eukprot:753826-Hanusia_phi.AAC.3
MPLSSTNVAGRGKSASYLSAFTNSGKGGDNNVRSGILMILQRWTAGKRRAIFERMEMLRQKMSCPKHSAIFREIARSNRDLLS